MTIENDFLEFLQRPRCKTAMLCITILIFFTIMIQEIRGGSSTFMQTTAISLITFWAGRASKQGEHHSEKRR